MRHVKDPSFVPLFEALPSEVRQLANKNFALLQQNPRHPSLHFKRIRQDLWSVRVGGGYRALAIEGPEKFQWFWIGTHNEYDRLIR